MPAFISESQYASKPRKIHHGIAAARDLVSFAEKEQKSMAVLALDMKSGFDIFVYRNTDFQTVQLTFSKTSMVVH